MLRKIRLSVLTIMLCILLFIISAIVSLSNITNVSESISQSLIAALPVIIVTMIILFISIDSVIKHYVIRGLDQLVQDIDRLSKGQSDVVSCVGGCPEYERMSREINNMVKTITRTNGMLTRIFENFDAPFAVFEYNDNSKNVMATDRLGMLLGITADELEPMLEDKQMFHTRISWIIKNPIPGEKDVYHVNAGKTEYVRINIVVEYGAAFGMVADVTEDIRKKQVIIKERDYDPLTQIRNRLTFEREVSHLLEIGNLKVCAMVMIDLDKFKGINDNYGHAFGDEYLQRAAGYLKRFSEKNCIVARRSGDEFYLFLYRFPTKDHIRRLAMNFYRMLEKEPFRYPDGVVRCMKMSMGIAWYHDGVKNFDQFLKYADAALYEAKESGRNDFCEIEVGEN